MASDRFPDQIFYFFVLDVCNLIFIEMNISRRNQNYLIIVQTWVPYGSYGNASDLKPVDPSSSPILQLVFNEM